MATEKLDITQTIKDGVNLGLKNFVPFLLTVLLYVITIWIPYLNVGTTIGLYKTIIALGRGEKIDPVAIFNKENFKPMGGFFLLSGLLLIGTLVAFCFMIIPGYVMGIAWCFAIFFFLDKKIPAVKAMQLSYDVTMGNKWRIFFVCLICVIVFSIVISLLALIPKVGIVLVVIASILWCVIYYAIFGVMYDFFSKKADALFAERHCCHPRPGFPFGEPAPVAEPAPDAEKEDPFADVKTEA